MDSEAWLEVIGQIQVIGTSREFRDLCRRLEKLYRQAGVREAPIKAYQDALVSILADNLEQDALAH